jgi:cell division septation protein DedD
MLRFFILVFVLVNGLLLALNFGVKMPWQASVSSSQSGTHTSAANKTAGQLAQEKKIEQASTALHLMSASAAQELLDEEKKQSQIKSVCVDLGIFTNQEAKEFDEKIKGLSFIDRKTRREINDVANNMVYIPPLANKDLAEKKAAELRKLGITDFYIVQDQTAMRFAISLGVFKTLDAANAHLENLKKKGVRQGKIAARSVSAMKYAYQFVDITPEEKSQLEELRKLFSNVEMQNCKSSDAAQADSKKP